MERRKIVKRMDFGTKKIYYESLRSVSFGNYSGWERHGRIYDIKGLDNLVRTNNTEFIFEPLEIKEEDLKNYREVVELRKRGYQKQFKQA